MLLIFFYKCEEKNHFLIAQFTIVVCSPLSFKIFFIFQKKMEFLQEFIKTEEVDEKKNDTIQQPHISDETPYIELVKSER
jgi:hypothetical protein